MIAEILSSDLFAKALAWGLGALGGWLLAHLVSKVGSAWAREALARAYSEVRDAVLEVHQTYVSEITRGRADGRLTDEEKLHARELAIGIAKSNLGVKGLKRLLRVLGLADGDEWLGTKVEASVVELKSRPH